MVRGGVKTMPPSIADSRDCPDFLPPRFSPSDHGMEGLLMAQKKRPQRRAQPRPPTIDLRSDLLTCRRSGVPSEVRREIDVERAMLSAALEPPAIVTNGGPPLSAPQVSS